MPWRDRSMSHKAADPDVLAVQQAVGRQPAKPFPKRKEKRLINGKWTRDWEDGPPVVVPQPNLAAQMMAETPPPVPLSPVQQRMRELAAKLKEKQQ